MADLDTQKPEMIAAMLKYITGNKVNRLAKILVEIRLASTFLVWWCRDLRTQRIEGSVRITSITDTTSSAAQVLWHGHLDTSPKGVFDILPPNSIQKESFQCIHLATTLKSTLQNPLSVKRGFFPAAGLMEEKLYDDDISAAAAGPVEEGFVNNRESAGSTPAATPSWGVRVLPVSLGPCGNAGIVPSAQDRDSCEMQDTINIP